MAELAELAYRNAMDEGLRMKTRESWYQKYTNAVLALNQLLKDLQYKEYEKRLRVIEESRRFRRTVLSGVDAKRWLSSIVRKNQHAKKLSRLSSERRIS